MIRNCFRLLVLLLAAWMPVQAGTTLAAASLYAVRADLVDQDGRHVGLDVFRGAPTVIGMFYGTCTAACPMLMASLGKMEAALTDAQRQSLRVLLVSFDPARDTPDVLRKLAAQHHIDTRRWKLVRPTAHDARTIAALLNISYRQTPDGEFNHSSPLTLLDGAGVPVRQAEGSAAVVMELAEAVRTLAQ